MDQEKIDAIESHQELLSVVIPVFNEELVIEESITRIRRILEVSRIVNEIIVVNDGSTDTTLDVLFGLKKSGPLRIINLSSNSGHMNAIRVGLENSKGDYIVTIDADLQDPPEAIPDMFKIISSKQEMVGGGVFQRSYDVVQAYRIDRTTDSIWKRKGASMYYTIIKKITGIGLTPHAADYRIMKRHVVDKLVSLPEKNLVYRLLIPSLGFHVALFPIERNKRFAGTSKYTLSKMFSLGIDSIISFTYKPLRLVAVSGLLTAGFLFLGAIATFTISIFGSTVPGWASLVLLVLSTNAFLLATLGLVGEYVGRIYELVQSRPRMSWSEIES
jgi:dolichol-phosphate mannosyltransferase